MSDQRSDRARFQDRVMIVTGAAQGIGRRVAERAAADLVPLLFSLMAYFPLRKMRT